MEKLLGTENDIIIYNDSDKVKVETLFSDENIWLPLSKISILFERDKSVISRHIKKIFAEEELDNSVVANFATTASDGKTYQVTYYNLDMIISIGYRVNSKAATKFRQWATKILKEYMVQGFALDDDRFIKGKKSDFEYFKRLLERIKLIRTSERMFYQKITDIFAECSIDYDNKSESARDFYAKIQNKFHYAITNHTAAEIIYNRVDSQKENLGLTTWKDSPDGKIIKSDVSIAKNYLTEQEIKNLNNIVNIFLDIAEDNAERKIPMYMKDWITEVDAVLKLRRYDLLDSNGKVTANKAKEKAEIEYDKYKIIQDRNYVSDFDKLVNNTNMINENKDI